MSDEFEQRWLSDLPATWTEKRADFLCSRYRVTVNPDRFGDDLVAHYSIPQVQETGGPLIEPASDIDSSKLLIDAQTLLVSKLNPRKKTICIAEPHSEHPTLASGEFVAISSEEMDRHYAYYLWCSEKVTDRLSAIVQSVTRSHQRVNPSDILKLPWKWPPLAAQRRIARFLDKKTARIDRLIEKKRALLDRLAEKRQALITRAVTKGLNPDAPMKPSGIDWLGDIPGHWEVKRLRFLLNGGTLNGLYKTKEEFDPEGIPFVQMGEAFRSPVFDGGTEDCVSASKGEVEKWGLLNGDFLIARRSIVFEGSGKSVLVSGLEGPHLFESSMIRIRPLSPQEHSEYLFFYFQSHIGRETILSVTKRVTISGIDSQQLKSIHVPVPPNSEACAIATVCENCHRSIQSIEREVSASIEKLAEYRSALITAAVTGQLAELQ